jgi:putative flippase GtrA
VSTRRQLLRFAAIGVVGTGAYVGLYLALRCISGAQLSGAAARVLLAVPTTWLNGRWTFGRRVPALRLVLGAMATVAVGAAVTSGFLALQHLVVPDGGQLAEVAAVVVANVLAAAARFGVMRHGVFAGPGGQRAQSCTRRSTSPPGNVTVLTTCHPAA